MENAIKKCCEVCQSTEKELMICGKCQVVHYCSVECQTSDWPNHKRECYELKEIREWEKGVVPTIDHFKNLAVIGEGNFSEILKATHRVTKKVTAIKRVNKFKLSKVRKERDLNMEKHCLGKLKGCPFVIEIFNSFQDELNYYINFEYVQGGELWDLCKTFGLISISKIRFFVAQIVLALEQIHAKGIIHRDLKPENILIVPETFRIKFVDFGTARDLQDSTVKGSGNSAKGKRVYEDFVGTPNFMPPEAIHNTGSSEKTDIWALGGTAYQLFSGFPPFVGGSEYIIFKKILEEEIPFEENWNETFKDLIQKMLVREAENRISLEAIKAHPFFQGFNFQELETWEHVLASQTKIEEMVSQVKAQVQKKEFKTEDEIEECLSNIFTELSSNCESSELTELQSWKRFLVKRLSYVNKIKQEFEY